ncbi:MAG: hypothetical protein AAF958_01230 [Planctomycetota bacterium]
MIRVVADTYGIEFEYDSEAFNLRQVDGGGIVNLANLYTEHCKMKKADRQDHLKILAAVFGERNAELPHDFEDAKLNLRAKIWNRSIIEFSQLKSQVSGESAIDIPHLPVGSHLIASIVFDTEHAMRSLTPDCLAEWGVSFEDAMKIAIQNVDDATTAFGKIGDNMFSSMTGDAYDSSRVLASKRIESFDLQGDAIAMVPNRETFMVAGSKDATALKILFELSAKAVEDDTQRPLCPLPMIRRDGVWHDWVPPKNHALREDFEVRQTYFLAELYDEQKTLLEQRVLAGVVDETAFIASFSGIQRDENDPMQSYCVWGRGVETLLPQTQYVFFADGDNAVASAEWDHVLQVAGELMEKDESYYPARFRVTQFPSDEQIQSLGNVLG